MSVRVENSRYVINANAKLNIMLKVTGRRSDGYHLLSMYNVLLDLADVVTLEILESDTITLSMSGITKGAGGEDISSPEHNIAVKAARGFKELFGIQSGVSIHIQKIIPVGAGLGGGSSNAAAVLRGLARIHSRNNAEDARKIALLAESLGADVPFFLLEGGAFVSGIGEKMTPCNVATQLPVVVFSPTVPLATKDVFRRYAQSDLAFSMEHPARVATTLDHEALLSLISNDLEDSASELLPELKTILNELREVPGIVASMTGSGSALFCISRSGSFEKSAQDSLLQVAKRFNCTLFHCQII